MTYDNNLLQLQQKVALKKQLEAKLNDLREQRKVFDKHVIELRVAHRSEQEDVEIRICQHTVDKTYGYRRVWLWLEHKNIHRNPKTVLRVMKKYGFLSEIRRRRKWVNLGQQTHKYENLLKREFRADRPNAKWVTDISYHQCVFLGKDPAG